MKGYFQRLLARSASTHSAIHPMSRLPQASLPALQMAHENTEFAAIQDASYPAQPQQIAAHSVQADSTPSRHQSPNISATSAHAYLPLPGGVAASEEVAGATSGLAPLPQSRTAVMMEELFLAKHTAPAATAEAMASSHAPIGLPDDPPEAFRLMAQHHNGSEHELNAAQAPVIFPPVDVAQAQAQAAQLSQSPQKNFGQDKSGVTEVHVSIGRIEVTALQAPTPVKPVPAARRKALSLDEYLQQRQQGRR